MFACKIFNFLCHLKEILVSIYCNAIATCYSFLNGEKGQMNPAKSLKVIGDGDSPQTVYSIVQIRSTSTWNKASPRGRRDDMLPDDGSSTVAKNRGGSTSVRGRVRSPHISGGRRWLRCRQPACL